jgi:hypothetical protein
VADVGGDELRDVVALLGVQKFGRLELDVALDCVGRLTWSVLWWFEF